MFGFDPLSRNERAAADALHAYLDDLNAGVLAPHGEVDPNLQATVSQVHTSGRPPSPPRGLKTQLWEELMSVSALPGGPIEVPRARSIDHIAGPGIRSIPREPARRRARRQTLWLAAAALILLSVIAGLAYGPGGGGGSGRDGDTASMLAVSASPEAAGPLSDMPTREPFIPTGPEADPAGCTTHLLRLNEIDAILSAASRNILYEGGVQRPVAPETINLAATMLPPSGGTPTPTDSAAMAAIEPVYTMYWSCVSAGSTRQQLYLFTPSGIARQLMNSNGEPIWGNITRLGLPATDTGYRAHVPEITKLTTLNDGRVVVEYKPSENRDDVQYMIFRQIDGTWYIDETICYTCG